MNAHVLDIPEDPNELASWLDRHIAGLELAELVAELSAIQQNTPPKDVPLEAVLGDRRKAVLSQGLSVLPHAILGRLLRHPQLLFELQDEILLSGGPYWDRIPQDTPRRAGLIHHGTRRVNALFQSLAIEPDLDDSGLEILETPWWKRPAILAMAAAAMILIALIIGWQLNTAKSSSPWGWNRAEALADSGRPDLYLDQLAEAAEDWFKVRPEDRAGLTQRVEQFRAGCRQLIAAPHTALAPADRAWLVERCRAWMSKLEANLNSLEQGQEPLQVRDDVDKTVRKLIDTLHAKAAERRVALLVLRFRQETP